MRRRAGWLAAILLAGFVLAALWPFRWDPPRLLVNRVERVDGVVRFVEPSLLTTGVAPAWLAPAIDADGFVLRVNARTHAPGQDGPARILTLSRDPWTRNLTLGQSGDNLVLRVRTPFSDSNGVPAHVVLDVFEDDGWRDLECRIGGGRVTVAVDGAERLDAPLPESPLQGWSRDFPLVLGNEGNWDRPWNGDVRRATVTVGATTYDCLDEATLQRPDRRWVGVKFDWWGRFLLWDVLLNFFGFVFVGYSLAFARGRRILAAVAITAAVCLAVEALQLCFHTRQPSLRDWTLNVLGALAGAAMCRMLGECAASPGSSSSS